MAWAWAFSSAVKADSATVYFDWGKASAVKNGDAFTIFREKGELKHPVTGEVLGHAEETIANGMIDHVEDKFSVGRLLEGKGSVALQSGDRLRVFFKDAKWTAGDRYGGTKADFSWENDGMGSVFPRLLNWKPAQGKMQLLVSHNIQVSPIPLAHLKVFKDAELWDLAWNGLEMAPLWKLPVSGQLSDFGTGDILQRGSSQLWIAAVGAGDKTVLLAYQIP